MSANIAVADCFNFEYIMIRNELDNNIKITAIWNEEGRIY